MPFPVLRVPQGFWGTREHGKFGNGNTGTKQKIVGNKGTSNRLGNRGTNTKNYKVLRFLHKRGGDRRFSAVFWFLWQVFVPIFRVYSSLPLALKSFFSDKCRPLVRYLTCHVQFMQDSVTASGPCVGSELHSSLHIERFPYMGKMNIPPPYMGNQTIHTYSWSNTFIRFQKPSWTFIHVHIPSCTFMQLHALSHTFMNIHTPSYSSYTLMHPHAPSYTFMHLHGHSYSFIHLHTPSCTFTYLYKPSCTFMHLHTPSCTFMHNRTIGLKLVGMWIKTMVNNLKHLKNNRGSSIISSRKTPF